MPKFINAPQKRMAALSRKYDFQTTISSQNQKRVSIGIGKEAGGKMAACCHHQDLQEHKIYTSLKEILTVIRRCNLSEMFASEN